VPILAVLRGPLDLVHPRLAALDPDLRLRPELERSVVE